MPVPNNHLKITRIINHHIQIRIALPDRIHHVLVLHAILDQHLILQLNHRPKIRRLHAIQLRIRHILRKHIIKQPIILQILRNRYLQRTRRILALPIIKQKQPINQHTQRKRKNNRQQVKP